MLVVRAPRDLEAVEVKYRRRIDMRGIVGAARAFQKEPLVVVTKDRLEHRDRLAMVPAPLFLWCLG